MTTDSIATVSSAPVFVSVIVPFHRNLEQLRQCLAAAGLATSRLPASVGAEIIIVADGAVDDPAVAILEVAPSARVLHIPGPQGPAVARNRGAEAARGDLLVFIDTDIVISPDALGRFVELFGSEPTTGAAFGAYDEEPADPGFFSQCRNLAHSFIHQRSSRDAQTFWAGLGAVRTAAFVAVGGFDQRFRQPSVEDIDLGYRLRAAGVRIVLDASIRGKHLKRWTFRSAAISDIRDRGVPWTQLLSRYGGMRDDLNISVRYRACVVVTGLLLLCLSGIAVWPLLTAPAAIMTGVLWRLDAPYYRFFVARRGWLFTLRWFPFHILHHVSNGVSFVIGTLLHQTLRLTGVALPGALPLTTWPRSGALDGGSEPIAG